MTSFYQKNETILGALAKIRALKEDLKKEEAVLENLYDDPRNNVFESEDEAWSVLENKFLERAEKACEGRHCLGLDKYTQDCTIAGEPWVFRIDIEYNRHDKTYYYIDTYSTELLKKDN